MSKKPGMGLRFMDRRASEIGATVSVRRADALLGALTASSVQKTVTRPDYWMRGITLNNRGDAPIPAIWIF